MLQHSSTTGARWLLIIGLVVTLAACGADQRELEAYIDSVKARPGRGIEPLPEFRPAPSYVYEAGDRRSPFVPDAPARIAVGTDGVSPPDPDRPPEFLEQMPLDTLAMVGTLGDARGQFGLVQDSDGRVHRVRVGNYMGQNYGRITSITEAEIQLVETVRDGLGGHMERPATMPLSGGN